MKPTSNYWIFQANPQYYDLRGALRSLHRLQWGIFRYKDKIVNDDIAFLWESGPDAGILAQVRIEDVPKYLPELEEEKPFMRNQEKFDGMKLQVPIKIQYVLPYQLSKVDLKLHPILKDMQILRFAQGTNFPLTQAQGESLLREIEYIQNANKELSNFDVHNDKSYLPTKADVEFADSQLRKNTDEVIHIEVVLNQLAAYYKKSKKPLKNNWREITILNIPVWFGKKK